MDVVTISKFLPNREISRMTGFFIGITVAGFCIMVYAKIQGSKE